MSESPDKNKVLPGQQPKTTVDYERYQQEYDARLAFLNSGFHPYPELDSTDPLMPSLELANASFDPFRQKQPDYPSGTGGKLKAVVRRLLKKLIRFAFQDEFQNIVSFNSTTVNSLNTIHQLLNEIIVRQRDFNSNCANFGQKIVPLIDGKILEAYTKLDSIILTSNSLLMQRMDLGFSELDMQQETTSNHMEAVDAGMQELVEWLHNTKQTIENFQQQLDLAMQEYRHGLLLQRRAIEHLNTRPANSSGVTLSQPEPLPAFSYFLFEQDHRGQTAHIKDSFKEYLPYFSQSPVLDIGCGRGEMLELLRERGIQGRGIDANTDMVETCIAQQLQVEQADALSFLKAQEENSFAGIFMAQVIEHIPTALIGTLLDNCFRVLSEDGVCIIETVNPTSFYALAQSFYKDLTHQWPIHPDTLSFLLRMAGFKRVEVLYRSPVEKDMLLKSIQLHDGITDDHIKNVIIGINKAIDQLNNVLYGFRDYAVIASK